MNTPEHSETTLDETNAEEYAPLLLAFGPADHDYEAEGADDAESYILGYN